MLGAYLLATMFVGVYCSARDKTTEDFFLSGRRVPWRAISLGVYGTQFSALTYLASHRLCPEFNTSTDLPSNQWTPCA